MTKTIIQALLLTIVFIVILYHLLSQEKKPYTLTIVKKNIREQCKLEYLPIYDQLSTIGLYVSPSIQCGRYLIPLALEPYHLAILDRPATIENGQFKKKVQYKFKSLYIRSKGWKILYVDEQKKDLSIKTILDYITSDN